MNALESQLDYPFGDALPERGSTIEVAPGVLWARMGLPFALDHINVWVLRDEMATESGTRQGWTIVDCGIDSPDTRAAWETIFADALGGLPVLRVGEDRFPGRARVGAVDAAIDDRPALS